MLKIYKNYEIIYKEIIIDKTEKIIYEDKTKKLNTPG